MLNDTLLAILRCPATKQPLHYATAEEKKQHGLPESEEVLVTEDGTRVYRVINGLPILLSTNDVSPLV